MSLRQKEYLKSVADLSPNISNLEMIGCGKCDPMIKKLCDPTHTINDGLLEKQVVFVLPENTQENGKFQFDRIFYETFMSLPSFERNSKISAIATSTKLKNYPISRQDLDFKLASDYLNGKTQWRDQFLINRKEETMKYKENFLPRMVVYNQNSTSTVFRIVVTPNRQLPSLTDENKKLSYNSCIREYSMILPSIEIISILHNLAVLPTALDLKDGFKSLENSIPTALSCMSHYYRNKQGNPCVSILESDNSGLHALVPIFSTYGYSDLPMIFQFAVSKTIRV